MPEPQMSETVGSVDPATSASSDAATLAGRAISALPPELVADVVDPKRKARSQDPRWKYGWWPDPMKKDFVQCIFCMKVVPAGIKRFKHHLAGGYGDTIKCVKVLELISREMHAYFKKNSKVVINLDDEGGEQRNADSHQPSSGTKYKQARKKVGQSTISFFVVSAATTIYSEGVKVSEWHVSKTLEEVVAKRHKSSTSQSTLEHCTKKGNEAKQIVHDHVVDFLYENRISLHVVNSRSWEIMLESIGHYGPGYWGPSYHDARVPWLERAMNRTSDLRTKHEEAWKEYGCLLMSDGWTDTRQRHLIIFFANSPIGTYFLGSVDASSEVTSANMLVDLLEKQINKIGKEHVVQVITDNRANFKAAGRILMERSRNSTVASIWQRRCRASSTSMVEFKT
jgi:hypothetical protein